ncbi:MAG: lipopolysaccharide heptosyltransferase II [Planctomycetota bacterium]|nr:lipopolysaccharide heptosyltransferase II [Planctomycetota bacterium]
MDSSPDATLTSDSSPSISKTPTIAVIMPNWIGDACMATPTLRSLRQGFPDARLVGVMSSLIDELLPNTVDVDCFDQRILFHRRGKQRVAHSVSRSSLMRELRKSNCDTILILPNSFWSAAVAFASRIPRRVGYRRDGRAWLLTDALPVPKNESGPIPVSAIDYYLKQAEWLGCESQSRTMQLSVTPQDQELADQLWSKLGFSSSLPTVVINSNSAKDGSRVWPKEKVAELATRLAAKTDLQVLLHCGPGERQSAADTVALASHPNVLSMGVVDNLPLGLSRGVLQRAAAVVTTDSGARHIAVALDRPVVTLFGSTGPLWTATYNKPERQVYLDLDCQPCYEATCPLSHHRCMQDISVSQVYALTLKQIEMAADKPKLARVA